MTLIDIIEQVSKKKSVSGRYPARLIFVRNIEDYTTLVNELLTVCDGAIDVAQYARGDILPDFRSLIKDLASCKHGQLLLLSFGEYMRICIKREVDSQTWVFPKIWEKQQPESSTAKIIIPIFGTRELFDRIMPVQDERQQGHIWEAYSTKKDVEYNLTIYAPEVAETKEVDAANFEHWLKKWKELYATNNRRNFTLRTNLFRYAETVYGDFNVNIYSEPFSYIASTITDSKNIRRELGSDELWKFIANNVVESQPFEHTLKRILNIGNTFEPVAIFARFSEMTSLERELLLVWYKLYPSQDYCSYALSKISSPADICSSLRDAFFSSSNQTVEFITQRFAVLRVLDVVYGEDYFAKLDKIESYEMRLQLLTCKAPNEQAYAIKMISELLRNGTDINTFKSLLIARFPEMWEYIKPTYIVQGDVGQYFDWYRKAKIINRPNTDTPCTIDYVGIANRFKVIQQYELDNCKLFWVDGLGVEWLPLLMNKLQAVDVATNITSEIAKSKLPSETSFNQDWMETDEKWDALDKLSHGGITDNKNYFSCIVGQIDIIKKIAQRVAELLQDFDRVIITSDHGSSRLAALSFHDKLNFAIEPPKNAKVCSFGRYAELAGSSYYAVTESVELVERDNRRFVVLKTYEHFKQSGNAAGGNTDENAVSGEIHGGMTPEEHLVPVIIVSRREPLPKKTVLSKRKGIVSQDMGLS